MPVKTTTPEQLKPYLFHGVNVDYQDGKKEATGDCPFCGREGKFSINVETGLSRCYVCNEGAETSRLKLNKGLSPVVFLRKLWDTCNAVVDARGLEELRRDRRLLYAATLANWGVTKSILTGEWLIPAYGSGEKLDQLYRYVQTPKGKRTPLATTGLEHALHGVPLYDPSKPVVVLCEGPWDGMVLRELLALVKRGDGTLGLLDEGPLSLTSSEARSLLATTNVLATPGCNVFDERWLSLFAGKIVVILFDNDYPKTHPVTGAISPPAGFSGAKRVANLLAAAEEKPKAIHYLEWGDSEKGYDPSLPHGYDVRDLLTNSGKDTTSTSRLVNLSTLTDLIVPIPEDWVKGRSPVAKSSGAPDLELKPCSEYRVLTNSWRKSMKWLDGLDVGLSVMLATITSTKLRGDQLWIKLIGPPSSGKSVLCEAVSVNKQYVTARSVIRGFSSGFKLRDESEDNGLIPKIKNKTLVTKDGDTLLQSPNLGQVLSEARDLFDGVTRTEYRNRMGKIHEGLRVTWILAGTESLRLLDSSELGERFVDVVVIDEITAELENEVGWRVALRASRDMNFESDGTAESWEGPDMTEAKQLTGGYVDYLRKNAPELVSGIIVSDASLRKCQAYARFVSYIRARPSSRQKEKAQRELSYRLISQFVRLAKCLAVVLNRNELDEEVMRRVRKVALDTARGRTLEIARHLYESMFNREEGDPGGMTIEALHIKTGEPEGEIRSLLLFLRRIKAIRSENVAMAGGSTRKRFYLTDDVRELYKETVVS